MNIPVIITQNVSNKLRNEEIQDEARASFVNYTARLYYNNTINNYKEVCEKIYGKLPYLTDSKFGELFTKLQNIMESTGIKIEKMVSDIKNYLVPLYQVVWIWKNGQQEDFLSFYTLKKIVQMK